jgi:hypothetical protein
MPSRRRGTQRLSTLPIPVIVWNCHLASAVQNPRACGCTAPPLSGRSWVTGRRNTGSPDFCLLGGWEPDVTERTCGNDTRAGTR